MREDNQSLSHTTYNCKYHIVFAPKYHRQIIYGRYKASIGKIKRDLCERKGVVIHEANACSDHIHMFVSIPPKLSVARRTHENFLFILLCPDINFEKIPF
ncbi:IS200/IS605 family transposase [Streptococcus pluranimalium]